MKYGYTYSPRNRARHIESDPQSHSDLYPSFYRSDRTEPKFVRSEETTPMLGSQSGVGNAASSRISTKRTMLSSTLPPAFVR